MRENSTTDATDEADDALGGAPSAPARPAPLQRQATPAEGAEHRVPSVTARFSDDTLRAVLTLQEESQPTTSSRLAKGV